MAERTVRELSNEELADWFTKLADESDFLDRCFDLPEPFVPRYREAATRLRELDGVKEDRERLDWLDAKGPEALERGDELMWAAFSDESEAYEADDIRAAIDAARSARRADGEES
jgi:hypothetical protein